MYDSIDLKIDSEGDLEISGTGDLKLATPSETLQQDILFRLKTEHADYVPIPNIGANLRSFVGEPNNERTGKAVAENVHISLTKDLLIPPPLLFVDAVPLSIHTLGLLVMYSGLVEGQEDAVVVSGSINLTDGGTNNESILNTTVI